MLKSKIALVLLSVAILTGTLKAQSYVKSYYITLKGDTVRGTALINAYTQMSKEIRFKTQKGDNLVLKPEAVQAVWLSPDRYFEAHKIHFRNVVDELNGVYFLRYISKTDSLTLLKFECDQNIGLYIQKKGEAITPLLIFQDFVQTREDNLLKKEVTSTDTVAYSDQMNRFGGLGQYKTRKQYLFLLYQYFNYCDVKIMNSSYILTEKAIKKAFNSSAKCVGKQDQIKNYFTESSWKPSIGITLGRQIASKEFNYDSPLGVGIFINYSDLRDGVGFSLNWLSMQPKATALSPTQKGSFSEFSLTYNRKVFLREKFNISTLFGVSFLKDNGLAITQSYLNTPFKYIVNPNEESLYGIVGVAAAYQFSKNNYLTAQLVKNVYHVADFRLQFDRVQLQYEHRF